MSTDNDFIPPRETGRIRRNRDRDSLFASSPKEAKDLMASASKLRRARERREWFDSKGSDAFNRGKGGVK